MNIVFAEYRNSLIDGHSPEARDKVHKELKIRKSPFIPFSRCCFQEFCAPVARLNLIYIFHKVFDFWRVADQSLGVEIDSRVIAFLFSRTNSAAIDQVIQLMNFQPSAQNRDTFRANVLNSLIWPSGSVIRNLHISAYNPFERKVPVERIVLEPVLISEAITVDIEKDGWEQNYQSVIKNHGTVNIICTKKNTERISQFLNFVAVEPVYQDYLKVFARISRITQEKIFGNLTLICLR